MKRYRITFSLLLQLLTIDVYALNPATESTPAALPAPQALSVYRVSHDIYPKVEGDSVAGNAIMRQSEADKNATSQRSSATSLPDPQVMPAIPRMLTLKEAIGLALRNNPNVKMAELARITDKFGLESVLQQKKIQFDNFTLAPQFQNGYKTQMSAGAGATINAVSGTSLIVQYANNVLSGANNASVTLKQHLLQGFGYTVNNIPYEDAFDSEKMARLKFKGSIIDTVNTVITDYRNLVAAYNALDTNKENLKSQAQQIKQSEIAVKAGTMAPADLLQEKANLEAARLSEVQQEDALRTSYLSFLTSLGLVSTSNIIIDKKIVVDDVQVPTLNVAIQQALSHNIAYQQALIQLNITKRALIKAQDSKKWILDVSAGTNVGTQNGALPSVISKNILSPIITLSLSVPIDKIDPQAAVVNAKIQIEDAKMTLLQQKETLVSDVKNQWAAIQNQKQQIQLSASGEQLQKKTLSNAQLRLKYGKATVFEVNTLENNLLSARVDLISANINYLNDISTLYSTMGMTLDQWHIKLRY